MPPRVMRLGNIQVNPDGVVGLRGFRLATFTQAPRMGRATLAAGVVNVPTTAVTAETNIFLTAQIAGGTPGFLRVGARNPGIGFQIQSSSPTDTSVVGWLLVEPIASPP